MYNLHSIKRSALKVKSVQEAYAKYFAVHILEFEILQITWNNEAKNIRLLVFSFSSINLKLWCFLFCFFMWFAGFQILICELQSIWRKLLVLSWLYDYRKVASSRPVYYSKVRGPRPKVTVHKGQISPS